MCGRYALEPEDTSLAEMIKRLNREKVKKQGIIYPGDIPPVFISDGDTTELTGAKWGMKNSDNPRLIINARSETAAEKPMFADAVRYHRCLLPATSYFEWDRNDAAHTRMRISAGRIIYMAGLYRRNPGLESGMEFVVLTKPAIGEASRIHDRMPMILPRQDLRKAWLTDGSAALELLRVPPRVECRVEADEPVQMRIF